MNAVGEDTTHTYETLPIDASSAVPTMNAPIMTSAQNAFPPPPAYNASHVWNAPPVAPQWVLATIPPQNTNSSIPFYRTFLKAKPKALGIVLIVAAVLQIGLGIGLAFMEYSITSTSGISFWGSVFYIIAGGLTIGAQCNPNISLVKGSLSLNIISSIFSLIAAILNCVDLATLRCYYYYSSYNSNYYYICLPKLAGEYVLHSLLLVINLLLFCVSFSVSIFGCRSLSRVTPNVPQVFVIQNDGVVSMNPSTVPTMMSPPFAQPAPALNIVQQVTAKQ